MSERRSQAWKDLERESARILGGQRITRPWDLFEIRDDIEVDGFEHYKVDCKYRAKAQINTLLNTVRKKYCQQPADVPVVITKTHHEVGAVVSLPLSEFARLLNAVRRQRKESSNV